MPGGELVMYIRSDDNPARTGMKAISRDGGRTWDGPYAAGYWPIAGRVNAGVLSSGEALVVHRVGGFEPSTGSASSSSLPARPWLPPPTARRPG